MVHPTKVVCGHLHGLRLAVAWSIHMQMDWGAAGGHFLPGLLLVARSARRDGACGCMLVCKTGRSGPVLVWPQSKCSKYAVSQEQHIGKMSSSYKIKSPPTICDNTEDLLCTASRLFLIHSPLAVSEETWGERWYPSRG